MNSLANFRPLCWAFASIICLLVSFEAAAAGGRHGFRHQHRHQHKPKQVSQPHVVYPVKSFYRGYYPKYYGGFHARYFENIGVPPGDIGLRGNGIYQLPW